MNVRVSDTGAVIIPSESRERLGLTSGAEVAVTESSDGSVRVERVVPSAEDNRSIEDRIASVRGSRPSDMTTDEFMQLMRGED